MVTEHPSHLRAHAQETWRQIFKEELRMFDTEAAWADFVRSTLTSARELGDAVERSGECPTEHLQCAAPRYWPVPRQLATLWGWPPRLMLVVAAGRRWVDPIGGQRAVDRGYATRHVILDHASRPGLLRGAERARGACPVGSSGCV